MNVDVRLFASRALFLLAVVLLFAVAVPASAEEVCLGTGGPDFIFHFNYGTSRTSVGEVITLVGLLRSSDGGAITLDPVTGTAVIDAQANASVGLIRAAPVGTTIYNARLSREVGVDGGFFFWLGVATVNRLPQGTILFPQTTASFGIVDCATGFLRGFPE